MRSFGSCLFLVSLFVVPGATSAQDATDHDRSLARALFEDGLRLADEGDFEAAADRFRRARDLVEAPAILYNLATADMNIGRLVEANEALMRISHLERADQRTRADADARLAEIAPRLARLAVSILPADADVTVSIDERVLPPGALEVEMPVDPGVRRVWVARDGDVVAERHVTLAEGETGQVVLEVPARAPVPPPARVPSPEAAAVTVAPVAVDEPPPVLLEDPPDEGDDGVAIALGIGAAVIVAVAGIVLIGLAAEGAFDAVPPHCGNADPCWVGSP